MNEKDGRPSGDRAALILLGRKSKGRVWIVETYANGRVPMRVPAEGYGFEWGQIIERPPNNVMVFDFYLQRLQEAYASRGRSMLALQERVFAELEDRMDCTLRDTLVTHERLLQDQDGWMIMPGALGRGVAFSVVCHFGADHFCRGWMIGEFIPDILPQVEEAVRDGLDADA